MTREDTRPHQDYSVAQNTNGHRCRFILLIVLLAITASVYFFATRSETPFGDRSEQSMFTSIPKIYTKLEAVDPEERDVFQGFEVRTSFLPDEIVVPRNKRYKEVYEGNVTSDILIWGGSEKQRQTPTRYKRMSRFTFTSEDYEEDKRNDKKRNQNEDFNDELENDTKEEYTFSQDQYDDNDRVESIVRPKPHVDRGPLDDVVEQIRSQPELEEGEMISSDHIYKTGEVYAGIHAFWKGQGNRETIRTTQANIMKQYMDAQADPCHDFYQYACGNWASLNPIPADKAGYDTFEMLRENLDSVLKDLLEFKPSDNIRSTYPGSHLALDDDFLKDMLKKTRAGLTMKNIYVDAMDSLTNAHNASEKSKYYTNKKLDESEIVNRIRRYLNQKFQNMVKPLPKIVHKYFNKVNHKGEIRKQRLKRHLRKTAPPVIKPKTIHKHRKNGLKKRHPRKRKSKRKFVPKSTKANVGRKLHMYTPPHRDKSRSERDTLTQQLASLDEIFNEDSFDINDPANGDAILKARYLFRSCMNYEILKKRGHQPLLDLLHLLGGWPILNSTWDARHFDWLELMAKLRLYNNDILISEWVGPDIKNSDEFVIQFDQTNLGLPTRDYFLQESNKPYLEAYKMYLIKIAMLLGGNKEYVLESAEKLIEFEIKLAKITSAPEDRRNVSELYRRMPLHKLEKLVPEVRWRYYLCVVMNRTVHPNETVVLFALTYVRHLVQLIKQTEPCILSNYLLWRFVRHRVNNLDDRFQTAKQQFYFTLFGREQAPPRWKNCISQVNSNMGMALGSMFVKKYFDEMSKNDTLTMTRDIQQAFRELLHKTDWIDDKTKKLAALKVDAMMLRIGYPDFILKKDELDERYKEVRIHPDKYFENILNILQHLSKMEQSRIGQPVNKTLWNTAPAVVNAYYSRNKNQIMFPAGILQPPFYHRDFPRSLNYGGIGVVIGHEITHGFDDKGRLFDCNGNLHRWWSDSAIEAFHRRAQCLIDQYGQYVVPEVNMKLDGVNTQGENIADNGGVKQAFRAYLHWLEKNGPNDETLPGLNHTHTQLFFLNFAQVWCGAMRPEAMRNKLKTAVHSPGRFRVIGTLSNSHDFAREFRCAPGTPMNPKHKCTVW